MSNTPNKSELKTALSFYQSKYITKKELRFFNSFYYLNESTALPPDLMKNRDSGRDKLHKNLDLMEKYYVYHLIKTIDTKWISVKSEDLVNHFYKNCKIIAEIWEGL